MLIIVASVIPLQHKFDKKSFINSIIFSPNKKEVHIVTLIFTSILVPLNVEISPGSIGERKKSEATIKRASLMQTTKYYRKKENLLYNSNGLATALQKYSLSKQKVIAEYIRNQLQEDYAEE